MKIICIIKRKNGTKVSLGGEDYHFKEDKNGVHVCDIKDEDHIKTLLNIPESFVQHGKKPEAQQQQVDDDAGDDADPEDMKNTELNAWAKEVGINPKSKQSIKDYVEDNELNITFLANDNAATMIRKVVEAQALGNDD